MNINGRVLAFIASSRLAWATWNSVSKRGKGKGEDMTWGREGILIVTESTGCKHTVEVFASRVWTIHGEIPREQTQALGALLSRDCVFSFLVASIY